ncbi:MAG TPA: hypothetical protein VI685_27475 [Candidatus Angelobacter sp.]
MNIREERIPMARVVELLFNDSSKNFADLKSRQWTATNLSVVAIMALAALTHQDNGTISPRTATVFMSLIVVGHAVVFGKCHQNLAVFRERLKSLVKDHFSEESMKLFPNDEKFQSVVADEGRITIMLFAFPLLTFVCGLLVVWL